MSDYDPRSPEGRQALRDTLALGSQPWTAPLDGEFDAQGEYVLCRAGFKNLDGTTSPAVFVAAFDEPDDLYVAQGAATALPAALDCIEEQQRRIEELEARIAAVRSAHPSTPIYPLADDDCYAYDHVLFETANGEMVCTCAPPVFHACEECRDEDGSYIEYPCSTIRALDGEVPK